MMMWSPCVGLLVVFISSICGQSWNTNPNPNNPPLGYQQQQGAYGASAGGLYNNDNYNRQGNYLGSGSSSNPFQVVYEWPRLDYNWLDEQTRQQALSNRRFIPENNALAGIRAWRDRYIVTIPRWKEGIPVTIASIPAQPQGNLAPRLDPFPNWQMQEIGNCTAFQFVQNVEIDTEGKIWIIDSGRVNILNGGRESRCPPKLVVIDMNSVQFPPNQFGGGGFQNYPGSGSYPNQQYPNQPLNNPNQYSNQFGSNPNQFGSNPNQYGNNPNQFGNNPNQYGSNPNQYGSNPSQYANNPNPNQYGANNPPYQFGNNPNPYNNQGQFNNPNQYNPNQYNNPSSTFNNPNQFNQQYNQQNQYRSNQFGPNQNQYNQNYNQFNFSQFDQFGNPINRNQFGVGGQFPYNIGSNFRILRVHNFPSNVATQYGAYLNDIVLDNSNGWYAYITDHGDEPGIIVYSFREDRSWKVKDARSMRADPDVGFTSVNNIDVELRNKNIDGIALSPAAGFERTLYFSPLGSYNLYSIPTSALKSSYSTDVSGSVTDLGRKQSITDGMIMDNRGNLYFGLLGLNSVGIWNTNHGRFTDSQRVFARDTRTLQWPDSFAIDEQMNLLVVTNRLQNYLTGRVNSEEPNYRILRAPIGARSYMAPADLSGGGSGLSGNRYDGYDSNNYGSSYYGYGYYGYGSASISHTTAFLTIFSALFILFSR